MGLLCGLGELGYCIKVCGCVLGEFFIVFVSLCIIGILLWFVWCDEWVMD